MSGLQTEFSFTLPKGYVDKHGTLHRRGTMRLATARDEIEPLRDPRVSGADDPFLTVIVLSRVLTELGSISQVTPNVIENLFTADLAFLQDFYGIINFGDPADLEVLRRSAVHHDAVGHSAVQDTSVHADMHTESLAEIPAEPASDPDDYVMLDPEVDVDAVADTGSWAETPRGRRGHIEEVKAPARS